MSRLSIKQFVWSYSKNTIHYFCHFKNQLQIKSHIWPQINIQFPTVGPLISFLFTLTSRVSPWARIVYSVSGRSWWTSNGTRRITTRNDKRNIVRAYCLLKNRNRVISAETKQYSWQLSSEIVLVSLAVIVHSICRIYTPLELTTKAYDGKHY